MGEDRGALLVGAGPVGLLTAALLAVEGIRSTVLERASGPAGSPRAVHLDDDAQRVLDRVGVLADLRPHLSPVTRYELRAADGDLLHAFPRTRAPLGHAQSVLFHQPHLEAALRSAVEASELVDVRWGSEVVAVDAVAGQVEVVDTAGVRQRIRGEVVLACDGAASTVRRLLGIRSIDRGYDQRWLVVDLLVEGRPAGLGHPQQRCDPHRPATSVPVGAGRHRFEFMLLPGETGAELSASLPELLAGWGVAAHEVEVERQAVYAFHAVLAGRWRQGRVHLLGDAAHQMPPFFGQGLCSGFRDAANLTWKLGRVLAGAAGDELLDTYEAERRPQVAETIRRTALLGRAITGGGRTAGMARAAGAAALRGIDPLRRVVEQLEPPPLPPGPLVARRRGPGVVGRPFPQPVLDGGCGPVPADALLGPGFALVGWRTDPLDGMDAVTRRFWEAAGARVIRVEGAGDARDPGTPTDVTGELAAWFDRAGAEVAVVRPDRVVLGVARRGDRRRAAALAARVAAFS